MDKHVCRYPGSAGSSKHVLLGTGQGKQAKVPVADGLEFVRNKCMWQTQQFP